MWFREKDKEPSQHLKHPCTCTETLQYCFFSHLFLLFPHLVRGRVSVSDLGAEFQQPVETHTRVLINAPLRVTSHLTYRVLGVQVKVGVLRFGDCDPNCSL